MGGFFLASIRNENRIRRFWRVSDVVAAAFNTVLCMDPNATDGATSFTDLAGRTLTAGSQAEVETGISGFGGSSLWLKDASTNATWVTNSSANLDILGGDFTVEGFVRMPSGSPGATFGLGLIGTDNNASDGWQLRLSDGKLSWVYPGLTSGDHLFTWAGATTYHVMACRQGTQHYLGVNGVSAPYTITNRTTSHTVLRVGSQSYGGGGVSGGNYVSVRITKGAARYVGTSYTVPTAPFTL